MKVLFDHRYPFFLAHGGLQIQIEQTKAALEMVGIETEYLRWWDPAQQGDILHYVGRPDGTWIDFAHRTGRKVVMAELLTGLGSRSAFARAIQRTMIGLAKTLLPQDFTARMSWVAYQKADAIVMGTSWEARLAVEMFSAPPERVHVVPNGVESAFLEAQSGARGPWLVCTATITERKRVVELAEAAGAAQTPLWIIGKPYSEGDPYAQRFLDLVQQHARLIRYEGAISDRSRLAGIYREARGFVLLSTMESLSLSAVEAAACGCPLLLSDLPWAWSVFGDSASYCPISCSAAKTARRLREFYDEAPRLSPPSKPKTWVEVAHQLKTLYESLASTSR